MSTPSREVRLRNRPRGMPTSADFEVAGVDVPAPGAGEVQVRNRWMAVDPAMRGRMYDAKSYTPPFRLDAPMEGPAIGEVVASQAPDFQPGDIVFSRLGWREVFNAPAEALTKRDCSVIPEQAYLGIAGMTGLTAYVGLLDIAGLKQGDTVFVSAASGGVGSTVCQIAKLKGHTVIGSAGGARKTGFLKETLGLDEVIDYKDEPSLTKALARAAPEGIDVYFDNVGGDHLQAALAVANPFARFAICGMISQYNATGPVTVPKNLTLIMVKRLHLQGFIALDHLDIEQRFLADVSGWYQQGLLKSYESTYDGIDNALDAFFGLFTGDNIGRAMVKLA